MNCVSCEWQNDCSCTFITIHYADATSNAPPPPPLLPLLPLLLLLLLLRAALSVSQLSCSQCLHKGAAIECHSPLRPLPLKHTFANLSPNPQR
jgi:hypothetical protein